jgi:hypothetical protein
MLPVGQAGCAYCPRVACVALASGNVLAGWDRAAGAVFLAAGSARGRARARLALKI